MRRAIGWNNQTCEASKVLTRTAGGLMKRALILSLLLMATSCGRKLPAKVSTHGPAAIPEYEIAYRTGLAAFREATPDGELRATITFPKAVDLEPKSCEFAMHLGQSLLFLAQQQKLNWEEFESSVSEANAVLAFKQGAQECVAYEAFLNRLSAMSLAFRAGRANDAVSMINRAIELDPDDPMNWVVLSQLRPTAPRNSVLPIVRASQLAPDLPVVKYELGNYYLTNPETYGKAREEFEGVL